MKLTAAFTLCGVFMMGTAAGILVGSRMERILHPPAEVHTWDLTNPWERCLAAMEAAEIPGDMWECHEPK